MQNYLPKTPGVPLGSSRLLVLAAVFVLVGCTTQAPAYDSVQYRAERAAGNQAVAEFTSCAGQALQLDEQARESGLASQYQAAARTMDACLVEVDPHRQLIDEQERMQAHAFTVMTYFKAGDLSAAQSQLQSFEVMYGRHDLYFRDGTSFLDTFNLLLDQLPSSAAHRASTVNASPALKAEVRRLQYWQRH